LARPIPLHRHARGYFLIYFLSQKVAVLQKEVSVDAQKKQAQQS